MKSEIIYKIKQGVELEKAFDNAVKELKEGASIFNPEDKVISVFGSARIAPDNNYYKQTVEIGEKLAKNGYSVLTGGGPSIMEAALKGACMAGGNTYGINIILPHEQINNEYIKNSYLCDNLFTRKVLLIRSAEGYIIMPGGYGTLDELFDTFTLMATNIQELKPVVLIGTAFWKGLIDWIKEQLLTNGLINNSEFNFLYLTDSTDDAVNFIKNFNKQ